LAFIAAKIRTAGPTNCRISRTFDAIASRSISKMFGRERLLASMAVCPPGVREAAD
jgi:hypothetical protein